ncbi:MAG: ntpE [Chlamydiia bacterium]|nr:ntpE [Chlamydiia bacterium]
MLELEKSPDRIQAICEKIRLETLDPAKREAEEILEKAKKDADAIRELARRDAEKITDQSKKNLEEEKRIFNSSLEQAAKQVIETLKQKIEQSLFNPTLDKWIVTELGGAKELAKLIEVLIEAIRQDGVKTDLSVKIPQQFTPESIVAVLSKSIAEQLKSGAIEVSDFKGGVKVSMKAKHMTIDLSDETLKELIASFVRKDFRKVFFIS